MYIRPSMTTRMKRVLFALLSGFMMAFSWPYSGSMTPLIFIAWIPLLLLEHGLTSQNKKGGAVFGYGLITFLVFNLFTTWWIYEVSESIATKLLSAVPAIVLNSTFMAIAFYFFHFIKRRTTKKTGYLSLIVVWLAWEFLHLNWELSWPWLTLGNVFSIHINWVQWYEYTGILGGSLWILVINLLGFKLVLKHQEGLQIKIRSIISLLVVVCLPLVLSYFLFNAPLESGKKVEVVLVQPNIDPYNGKFDPGQSIQQLEAMLELAQKKISPQTQLVLFPETALQERTSLSMDGNQLVYHGLWENDIEQSMSIKKLRAFLENYPNLTLILGLSSERVQGRGEELTPASRHIKSIDRYYQSYNAALIIAKDRKVSFYHKSELVPAVEFMPLEKFLKPLTSISLDYGGTTGTLGTQEDQIPFFFSEDTIGISPAICYESIYGHSSAEFVRNGASILGIITNDGWWGDSPGFKQHVSYARLRAVETRRWVARAANTGISAFINPKGQVVQQSSWWTAEAMVGTIDTQSKVTFYAKYGDYLGRVTSLFSIMLVLYAFIRPFINR